MKPIKLTEQEQNLLKARKQALDASRESIAFQTTAETIASLHDANGPGWTINPEFSALIPPQGLPDMNQPLPA
jgi:hypothetical protein